MRTRLIATTSVLAILTAVHDLDHVRQGRSLHPVLFGVAVAAVVSIALTFTVLVTHTPWAKPVAVGQGVGTTVGVGAVHVAPQWTSLADSYGAADADIASWVIVIAMMATGFVLAIVALTSQAEN